jgi:hypothetical protein
MGNHTKTIYTIVALALMAVGYIIARIVELDNSIGDQFKVSDYLATLVAIGTFTYSFLGFKHNREQRTLSVTPHVLLNTVNNRADGIFGFYIKNYGIAPAIKINFKMYFDEALDKEGEAWAAAYKELTKSDETYLTYTKGTQALSPNEGEYIIQIQVVDKNLKKCSKVESLLNKITIKLEYESILGEKFKDEISYL